MAIPALDGLQVDCRTNVASNAVNYVEHYTRSNDAVIRVYDELGNVIAMQEHNGDFKEL